MCACAHRRLACICAGAGTVDMLLLANGTSPKLVVRTMQPGDLAVVPRGATHYLASIIFKSCSCWRAGRHCMGAGRQLAGQGTLLRVRHCATHPTPPLPPLPGPQANANCEDTSLLVLYNGRSIRRCVWGGSGGGRQGLAGKSGRSPRPPARGTCVHRASPPGL